MTATVSTRSLRRRPRRRARLAVACALVLATALAFAAVSRADVGATIIERCTHGQSLSGFSEQDYRQALRELPTEVEEYSDCANLIRHAELAAAGGGGPSVGGGAAPDPAHAGRARRAQPRRDRGL